MFHEVVTVASKLFSGLCYMQKMNAKREDKGNKTQVTS
jgi:hypothetical protein